MKVLQVKPKEYGIHIGIIKKRKFTKRLTCNLCGLTCKTSKFL